MARRGRTVLALVYEEGQIGDVAGEAQRLPGDIGFEVLDVTNPGQFAFPEDLDVLVNNAGIRLKNLPIEETPVDEWRLYMEVNFLGSVEMARRAIPILRNGGGGTIVNINSASTLLPLPFLGPYRAAKGALASFSETLRTETAPFGIRVVEIMPGAVTTGLTSGSMTTKVADAVDYPVYAPMARRQREYFTANALKSLEAAEAAKVIVDAVEDRSGRFRYGTDERSDVSIGQWRPGGGDPVMSDFIEQMIPGSASDN
ncbi:SDR family NAD(P)-dependent oxidoreductase [Rhodococcus rhodochrous]|uniref:SDR family NAD(P)-dependent oxidoreductase n=1 Tax=Rhodococcus rhodochrous TaxID=1829 RepID=UPI000A1CDBD4|nr:SDR family NAD(P)-dependent oxidoreductase [Rhodococcus rhodochrous]MCQ4138223.1 SDR family NAD(P)-dependent oxidoreductase [Rhodococcus rhodochrous]MDJ0021671.1 SDR family NAD(P)-dependent oxidoreductase [Rhodococcus rhodochrous]